MTFWSKSGELLVSGLQKDNDQMIDYKRVKDHLVTQYELRKKGFLIFAGIKNSIGDPVLVAKHG
jgi:hypothetical protein